jgi:hypothetical protein
MTDTWAPANAKIAEECPGEPLSTWKSHPHARVGLLLYLALSHSNERPKIRMPEMIFIFSCYARKLSKFDDATTD